MAVDCSGGVDSGRFVPVDENYTEFALHSAALVMSNLAMSAFISFVFWMAINVVLRWFSPAWP